MASNRLFSITAFRFLSSFFLSFIFCVISPDFSVAATQVTLAWDANVEPDLAGYHLYARQADQAYNYTAPAYVGRETSCTIDNLDDMVEHCFVVRAYDVDGNESPDSNEVCKVTASVAPADSDDDGDGFTENQGDCDDANATVNPGAVDICGDGIDRNCDGSDPLCPADIDDDGDGYTENQGDCDDANAAVNPGAVDMCGDGIDRNCDGSDPLCPADIDDDGDGYTENQGDCDDGNAAVNPGAVDACGDGIDQNCDGSDVVCQAPDADAGPDQRVAVDGGAVLNGSN